jgi:hypothetical protein
VACLYDGPFYFYTGRQTLRLYWNSLPLGTDPATVLPALRAHGVRYVVVEPEVMHFQLLSEQNPVAAGVINAHPSAFKPVFASPNVQVLEVLGK